MKSLSEEFDVFDERAHRVVDVATVLASNAQLTDLLAACIAATKQVGDIEVRQ